MQMRTVIKQNWLTRKMPENNFPLTFILVLLLITGSSMYLNGFLKADQWMPATGFLVLKQKEYWRLWSALFAHADLSHLFGNIFLFIPFSYFLSKRFSWWFFPAFGFLIGGIINLLVTMYLPDKVSIIGVSAVVYWMGAAWMSLSFFIDRRDGIGERLLKVSGVSVVLFFPTTFLPEVSYLSHFLGYFLGIVSGSLYYFIFRKKFIAAEVSKVLAEEDSGFDWENFNVNNLRFKPLEPSDFMMLHDWLNRDHVASNWNGLISLEEVNEKYGKRVHSESFFPFIVYFNDLPIGFIQAYNASLIGNGQWTDEPAGTYGIDQFIADKKLLGKGIGSTFIKKFTDSMLLREDVLKVISDPLANNQSAIRAYQKAGFKRKGKILTPDGAAILMEKN